MEMSQLNKFSDLTESQRERLIHAIVEDKMPISEIIKQLPNLSPNVIYDAVRFLNYKYGLPNSIRDLPKDPKDSAG